MSCACCMHRASYHSPVASSAPQQEEKVRRSKKAARPQQLIAAGSLADFKVVSVVTAQTSGSQSNPGHPASPSTALSSNHVIQNWTSGSPAGSPHAGLSPIRLIAGHAIRHAGRYD